MWENIRGVLGGCKTREAVVAMVWGEVVWIEGGPIDEIGLAEKSPPETRGGEIANLDGGIKEVKSGSGRRDWCSCWALTDRARVQNKTKLFSVSILLLFSI